MYGHISRQRTLKLIPRVQAGIPGLLGGQATPPHTHTPAPPTLSRRSTCTPTLQEGRLFHRPAPFRAGTSLQPGVRGGNGNPPEPGTDLGPPGPGGGQGITGCSAVPLPLPAPPPALPPDLTWEAPQPPHFSPAAPASGAALRAGAGARGGAGAKDRTPGPHSP